MTTSPCEQHPASARLTAALAAHRQVALVGPCGSGKSLALLGAYRSLLTRGVPSEAVLAFVSSSTKTRWHDDLAAHPIGPMGDGQFHTFTGWVQRELLDWWLAIEATGSLPPVDRPGRRAQALPLDLARVSLAQYLMARSSAAWRAEHAWHERLRTAPSLQVVHLLDTLGRGVEHGLEPGGLGARLKAAWTGPASVADCLDEAQALLDGHRAWMLSRRVLDHALQLEVFRDVLWPLPAYRASLRERSRYLLVDDLDESYPLAQAVFEALAADARGCVFVRNTPGGLRAYVGADPVGADALLAGCHAIALGDDAAGAPAELAALGRALHERLLGRPSAPVDWEARLLPRLDFGSRLGMLQAACEDLKALLESGVAPAEIAILAPTLDPFLIWHMRGELERLGTPLTVLAGTNRLVDHRVVRLFLTLAKAAHPAWGVPVARHEWLELLEAACDLDAVRASRLAPMLLGPDGPGPAPRGLDWSEGALNRYRTLYDWLERQRELAQQPIDAFFRSAFAELWAAWASARQGDRTADWVEAEVATQEAAQVAQLIDAAADFRRLVGNLEDLDEGALGRRFLGFLLGGTLAERPFRPRASGAAVTLATAHKYAEDGPPVRYQIWLDLGATGWWKSDARELSNPSVLSRHHAGGPYGPQEDAADQARKLGQVLWTNCLKTRHALRWYASRVDAEGRDQMGELPHLLASLRRPGYAGLEVRA